MNRYNVFGALLIITSWLLSASPADAQTFNHELKGLKEFQLQIPEMDKHAKDCGLSTSALSASLMYPASSAGFTVKTTLVSHVIQVQVISIRALPESCASSVHLQVSTFQNVTLSATGREVIAKIVHWQSDYLVTGSRANHARSVGNAVENLTKQFITTWNLDNK